MLFLVGLELEPQRLWSLRKPIFGWGSVQLFGAKACMRGIDRIADKSFDAAKRRSGTH